jgi:hypothetical protein
MKCTCRWLRDSAAATSTKTSRLGAAISRTAILLAMLLVSLASPAAAVVPPFNGCQNDVNLANDESGQTDLTQFCVEPGSGNFELYTRWSWDEVSLSGNNTGDGCALFDTDNDGNVNLSICVTVVNTSGGNLAYQATTLYTCGNDKPDRCTAPVASVPAINTSCTLRTTRRRHARST